jgi:tRNA (mo5U34)-methyltransferase
LTVTVPTSLEGWYHTIELGDGRVTSGRFDHRPVLDRYAIPASLRGMTALDIGTAEGFFAFEMERRGAERVVATDVADPSDWDWLPQAGTRGWTDGVRAGHVERFEYARELLDSRVEHQLRTVYELSPETVGTFDLVFCGSLLLHLQDPFRALSAIRSVTSGTAIVETAIDPQLEHDYPDHPRLRFGALEHEREPGDSVTYWWFTTRALEDMLAYAGFAGTTPQGTFTMPPTELACSVVHAHA